MKCIALSENVEYTELCYIVFGKNGIDIGRAEEDKDEKKNEAGSLAFGVALGSDDAFVGM